MAERMRLKGRTAVITGAASGIGRALAVSLAKRGCDLALSDLNEAGLAETARLAGSGVRVSSHRLDVADRAAVAAFPEVVRAAHGRADIVVNNAGVALGGTFEQVSEADFEWLFEINFWGVVRMTRAFLPLMRESDEARLVNLSSLYGLVAPPGQTAYSAAKFAVRGFSQALRHELLGTNIGVTVVHPGGVATQIARSARVAGNAPPEEVARGRAEADRMLRLPAEKAGEIIAGGIERREARVLVGTDAKIVSLIERAAPVTYWSLLSRLMRRK
ncbi:MAG TPA: SDR family NAD(P)-dependent oxidoreductase [Azospirillaceae bacterium]|nr:SDR family NAD(P)-dependent oxidoreductase [Azospirillaceae bacterium]